MHNAKKLILILVTLLWIAHPGIAAPTEKNTSHHVSHHKHHKKHHVTSKKKNKNHHHSHSAPAVAQTETAPDLANLVQTTPPPATSFAASIKQRLVDFVYNSVTTLRYSAYKMGGSRVDTSHGIYIVDCSGYVDHTLRSVFPNAYSSLVSWSGSEKPNTQHYYDFFTELSSDPDENWSKIEHIEQLQPGDILVFRYKNGTHGHAAGGHVMVVMNKPVLEDDAYLVSVADSAAAGHSQDTRLPHVSGVGVGTLLLKVNPKTGQPSAYAWKIGSHWEKNVNFAMARPVDLSTDLES